MEVATPDAANESPFFEEPSYWAGLLEQSNLPGSAEQVMKDARNFRELEALVSVLDSLETIGSMSFLVKEEARAEKEAKASQSTQNRKPSLGRDFWSKVGVETKSLRPLMQPLLSAWLDAGVEGEFFARSPVHILVYFDSGKQANVFGKCRRRYGAEADPSSVPPRDHPRIYQRSAIRRGRSFAGPSSGSYGVGVRACGQRERRIGGHFQGGRAHEGVGRCVCRVQQSASLGHG